MSELLNFPFVNQLDGGDNAEFDCVPASLCACLRYLTGNTSITPSAMKDAVYGPAWANAGTAASAFVDYCKQHGAHLYAVETSSDIEVVQVAHTLLAQGKPVIFTQQDDYAPPQFRDSWTHVCVWYRDTPGTLTAMDPFGAREITFSDSVWASRLRSNELWTMEKMMIDINTPGVSSFFKQDASGAWICLKSGNVVHGGILAFYKGFGPGLCGLTNLGLPESNEINLNLAGHPEVVVQRFERGIVAYDPHHVLDSPPGAGEVYLTHHAPDAAQIQQQADQATAKANALQQRLDQIKQLATN